MDMHFVDHNANMSRFAEESELIRSYTKVGFDTSQTAELNKAAGLCVIPQCDEKGKVSGSLVDGGDTNTIIVSSTGAGKTRRVLAPYTLSCILAGHNFLVHDPKGELYSFYKPLLVEKGYEIRILNLRNPMKGDRLNLLEYPARLYKEGKRGRATEIVRGIAQTIYKPIEDKNDLFWTEISMNLFVGCFTIAADLYDPEYVTLSAIYRIHVEGLEKTNGKVNMLIYLEEHKEDPCYELCMPAISAPNETRTSAYSVFTSGLSRLTSNDEIADTMTKSTFDPRDFALEDKRIALFIITRDEASQTYSTIVSAWVDLIYTSLIDEAQHRDNLRLPNTMHFILEEFGNIASLININDYLTASRSRGIRFVIVLQSLAQLYINYSRELANVLIGNSQNLVYMASTDMELVRIISERCGNTMDSYTGEVRPLLSPDRLTHLNKEKGEALMLLDRHYPYIALLPDISMYGDSYNSINIEIPDREKLLLQYGLFSKKVSEIMDKKVSKIMEELKPLKKTEEDEKAMMDLIEFADKTNDKSDSEDDGGKLSPESFRDFFNKLDSIIESE